MSFGRSFQNWRAIFDDLFQFCQGFWGSRFAKLIVQTFWKSPPSAQEVLDTLMPLHLGVSKHHSKLGFSGPITFRNAEWQMIKKRTIIWPNYPTSAGGHGNPLQYSCFESPHGQRIWKRTWKYKKDKSIPVFTRQYLKQLRYGHKVPINGWMD